MLDEGIYEYQYQTDKQTVNTGRLRNGAADEHCCGSGALSLRLSADSFDSFADSVAFTDTRADTCDKRKTCAYALTCENDSTSDELGLF